MQYPISCYFPRVLDDSEALVSLCSSHASSLSSNTRFENAIRRDLLQQPTSVHFQSFRILHRHPRSVFPTATLQNCGFHCKRGA